MASARQSHHMWPIRRGQESGSTPGAALRRTLFGILLYRIVWLSVLDGFIILISYFGSRRENGSGSTRGNHAPSWDRLLPCSGFLQVPPGLPCWTHGLHVGQESVESWALWDPPCEGCLSRRRCCEGCSLAPCPRTPAPTMGGGARASSVTCLTLSAGACYSSQTRKRVTIKLLTEVHALLRIPQF